MQKVQLFCDACNTGLLRNYTCEKVFCNRCKNPDSEMTYRCRGWISENGRQCRNFVNRREYDEDDDPHNYLFEDARPECLCSSCKRNRVKSIDQLEKEQKIADEEEEKLSEKHLIWQEAGLSRSREKQESHKRHKRR